MLICITGVDGCGKGTQIYLLKEALKRLGHSVSISKAYGDAEKESLAHFFRLWDDLAITMAFQALHRQQYVNAMSALKKGNIVIADRWDESYLAYHTQFGYLATHPVLRKKLNEMAFEGYLPDLGFLLNVSVEVTEKRMTARGKDFFDEKDTEYHCKMGKAYLKIARERDWYVIDGNRHPDEIHQEIFSIVRKKL